MKIGIVDYGSGNFASVINAVKLITNDIITLTRAVDFAKCSHIILPGVGAFAYTMAKIGELNLIDILNENVLNKKKPFLGICVGMQILANYGYEFGKTVGLGWIDAEVKQFEFHEGCELTLPHIGWNDVLINDSSLLFKNINLIDPSFYFVHSYHIITNEENVNLNFCNYGYNFPAAIEKENIFGVQFHPEKSQKNGIQVFKNFIGING